MGAGLSGLTAAWDLARKGYRVDIFDAAHMEAHLLGQYPDLLSEEIIAAELSVLEYLGVIHHREAAIHQAAFMEKCRSDFHAVFLSLEVTEPVLWGAGMEQEIVRRVEDTGFELILWEDHSDLLKQMAAGIVFEFGSMGEFWKFFAPHCEVSDLECSIGQVRPGYYLKAARKKGDVDE